MTEWRRVNPLITCKLSYLFIYWSIESKWAFFFGKLNHESDWRVSHIGHQWENFNSSVLHHIKEWILSKGIHFSYSQISLTIVRTFLGQIILVCNDSFSSLSKHTQSGGLENMFIMSYYLHYPKLNMQFIWLLY